MAILIDAELKKLLFEHIGHDIIVESYGGSGGTPVGNVDEADEVAVECVDCSETLISAKSSEN